MARKSALLAMFFAALALVFTGCSPANDGDTGTASGTASASASASGSACPSGQAGGTDGADCQPVSCDTVSPGSPDEASCQAAGIPGTTEDAGRCPSTTPSPIASGLIQGTFGPYCRNAVATTYDQSSVPDGATATVTVRETEADTTVELLIQGALPDTSYSGRMHQNLCGATPADAGEEYVNDGGPDGQSGATVLDLTTDSEGNATVTTTVPWLITDDGTGKSILLQAAQDAGSETTTPASDANAVACISLER